MANAKVFKMRDGSSSTVSLKEPMAARVFGRTKINALMNDRRLVKRKVDGRTLINAKFIRRRAGH